MQDKGAAPFPERCSPSPEPTIVGGGGKQQPPIGESKGRRRQVRLDQSQWPPVMEPASKRKTRMYEGAKRRKSKSSENVVVRVLKAKTPAGAMRMGKARVGQDWGGGCRRGFRARSRPFLFFSNVLCTIMVWCWRSSKTCTVLSRPPRMHPPGRVISGQARLFT